MTLTFDFSDGYAARQFIQKLLDMGFITNLGWMFRNGGMQDWSIICTFNSEEDASIASLYQ